MGTATEEMKKLLLEYLPKEKAVDTAIRGVRIFRRDEPYDPKPLIYKPQIIILAQGRKDLYIGDRKYTYDADNYIVLTVPLPVVCEAIIKKGEPMLGMVIEIEPQIIGEILYEMDVEPVKKPVLNNSMYQAAVSDEIIDAALRLLKTLRSKNETRILGQIYVKEILFKVLNGEHGEILKELAFNNRSLYQISRAINRIHEDFPKPLEVQTLAKEAGMSVSTFHSNFKDITSTSPLQYIKNIRLHKAKELIQQEGEKVYEAAVRVGYESSSQFNREYKRLFGITPAKDSAASPVH